MIEDVLVALIAAGAGLGAGVVAAVTTVGLTVWRHVTATERINEGLWLYTRQLIDHIYRGGLGPPPPPPDHIRHLYEGHDQ